MKKIVTIWWWNWHSSILKWFYDYLNNYNLFSYFQVSSIVAMSDDWRTTGLLMREMQDKLGVHLPPPWDLRKCLLSMSASPFKKDFKEVFETIIDLDWSIKEYKIVEILEELRVDPIFIKYLKKFDWAFLNAYLPLDSEIKGHKFWNILMASIYYNFWNYNRMMSFLSAMMEVKGDVFPVTVDRAFIFAELWNLELIESQDRISNIADYKAPVDSIYLLRDSNNAKLNERLEDIILEADYIIIWPWDLFTSIESNFLIKGLTELVQESKAKKIYILNSNNKWWETTNYDEIDFIDFINNKIWVWIDFVVANEKELILDEEDKKRFESDISVKWWRYLFIDNKKKKEILKKYPNLIFITWDYIDRESLYKNNFSMIEDIFKAIKK